MLKRYMAGDPGNQPGIPSLHRQGSHLGTYSGSSCCLILISGDILAFFYTRDIDEEKILREVMSSLITFGFDNAAYADLQTEKVRLIKTRPEALGPASGRPVCSGILSILCAALCLSGRPGTLSF
jgi:hypothetical protein